MKVSKVQLDILQKMNEGWELGMGRGYNPSHWLQKNGLGRGGDTQNVKDNSFSSLYKKELIKSTGYNYPSERWELTEKGKALVTA